jgi:excisionase family DNA binding protein
VIEKREWAAQAARIDNLAGGGLHDQYDYDCLVEDVQAIGLMSLGLGRADVHAICSTGEFLGHTDAALLLDRVAKLLEAPVPVPTADHLSIKQAAALSGLSPTKVRREVVAGRLAASKHGRIRIAKSDFEAWMEAAKIQAPLPPPSKQPAKTVKSRYFDDL